MSVSLSASLHKPLSLLAASEKPRLAVRILPTGATPAVARRSFHLGLLLDVSGSMDGDRLAALKTTIRLLIDALMDGDCLTVIKYESSAQVVAEAQIISSVTRTTLRDAIDALRADGGTNLEAAIAALRAVSAPAHPPLDAVFILTDGQINQGLTSATGLIRLLTASVPTGTPAHTLGFGSDVNSRMLRDMSMRTRGSYTYADANEVLPAVIADITAGLATEVGRNAVLAIPDGWTCMELSAEDGATTYNCGTLVADKPQWIVLTGPEGATAVPPLTLTYTTGGGAGVQTATLAADAATLAAGAALESYHAQEQYCRCLVATVQSQVQEHLESNRIEDAKAALTALGAELDANPEKDRTFVISLRAQVDEMLEALAAPVFPVLPLHRVRGAGGPAMPLMAPIISRMASNTAALANQNGFLSALRSTGPALRGTSSTGAAARAGLSGVTHTFSSPAQQETTVVMTQRYTQVAENGGTAVDEEEATAFMEAVRATMSVASPSVASVAAAGGAGAAAATP
jgi:uncharacterized protein YegL